MTDLKLKEVWDHFHDGYYKRVTKARARVLDQILPVLIKELGLRTCIEVGAGPLVFTPTLLKHGLNVVVTDIREENIALVREKAPQLDAFILDLDEPYTGGEQFDLVFAYGVIYHLKSIPMAVSNIRWLARKAVLIDSVVNQNKDVSFISQIQNPDNPSQAVMKYAMKPSIRYLYEQFFQRFGHIYTFPKPVDDPYGEYVNNTPDKTASRTQFVATDAELKHGLFKPVQRVP